MCVSASLRRGLQDLEILCDAFCLARHAHGILCAPAPHLDLRFSLQWHFDFRAREQRYADITVGVALADFVFDR